MSFPQRRLRRLRRTPALRRLVAETRLGVDDLIAPLFVREGIDEPQPIGGEEWLVIAETDGRAPESRIFLAAPVSLEDLIKHGGAAPTI